MPEKSLPRLGRRRFLKTSTAGAVGGLAASAQTLQPTFDTGRATSVPFPAGVTRHWPGPEFWANRIHDWRISGGGLECLAAGPDEEIRTAFLLTREVKRGRGEARFRVRIRKLAGHNGFAGFLIGGGAGRLDPRQAVLIQRPSGEGGGLLCCWESGGRLAFREHTDEDNPTACQALDAGAIPGAGLSGQTEIDLMLEIEPAAAGYEIRLFALSPEGELLAGLQREAAEEDILGSVALMSSPVGAGGARYRFEALSLYGGKLLHDPSRQVGPILGTLYSLNRTGEGQAVLKMSVQMMPLGEADPQQVRLDFREPGGEWRRGAVETIGEAFVALFRLPEWNPEREQEYRAVYPAEGAAQQTYEGLIRQDPSGKESLTITCFSCHHAISRRTSGDPPQQMPPADYLGRYTPKGFYFPHREVIEYSRKHGSELLLFTGDQLYESAPTPKLPDPEPKLDYLYKYSLWLWAFREITRDTPAIVLVDDHDLYQGNIWGAGGRPAPGGEQNDGGYVRTPAYANFVQRTQTAHNPDPFDPTPIEQGIGVYYTSFVYGGVSFAVVEDRKFKSAPKGRGLPGDPEVLLGGRQESFLESWAGQHPEAAAKVCVTQTVWACAQTDPGGRPRSDYDSNGYPKPRRDRAIALLRRAGALLLSGDQHLATLIRHGVEEFGDAIVQFSAPSAGTHFQRWFEPRKLLGKEGPTPHTGDFIDGFGNKFTMLAVANPPLSFAEYRKHAPQGQGLLDRKLKSDGYGIVRVDKEWREFVIECWPWNVDPESPGARQYAGWPYRLPFDRTRRDPERGKS